MRRLPALALIAALLLPAACGGGDDKKDSGPFAFPTVSSSKVGEDPKIISNTAAPAESMIKVLTEGTGRPVAAGDVLVTNLKGQAWDTGGVELPAFVDSFSNGEPLVRPLNSIVPAWEKKLPGIKVGSRVLLVAPPADGFGAEGNQQIGIFPTDSLMFVIDIVDAFAVDAMADGKAVAGANSDKSLPTVTAGKDPKVTVPKGKAPSDLVSKMLLAGTGAKIEKGQTIVAQYTGVLWPGGKVFDSSWTAGRAPFSARIAESDAATGQSGVIKGWVQGILGQQVGTRLLLIVPPALGYGKAGQPDGGIKGTDTLVFVIDLLGVYGKGV